MHRISLSKSFPGRQPNNEWLFCEKRRATQGHSMYIRHSILILSYPSTHQYPVHLRRTAQGGVDV